jgi:hypothetical protein
MNRGSKIHHFCQPRTDHPIALVVQRDALFCRAKSRYKKWYRYRERLRKKTMLFHLARQIIGLDLLTHFHCKMALENLLAMTSTEKKYSNSLPLCAYAVVELKEALSFLPAIPKRF